MPYGESLETTISERWGHICSDIAPPAQVLWTFDGKPIGPSAIGWQLTGVVWPDPPGTFRSSPTPTGLQVTETWRTGHTLADALQGTDPAVVIGDAVACPIPRDRVVESVFDWADGTKDFSNAIVPTAGNSMQTLADLMVAGSSLPDLPAAWADSAFDPELAVKPLACEGRILRSSTDDFPEPAPFAPDEDRELVKKVWNDTGFTPSEFANTIRLSVDSGLEHLELLLLVSERMLNEGLVVTSFDRDGNVVAREPVTGANMVHSGNPLPPAYTDPHGPWADPIERAGVIAARVVTTEGDLLLARVKVPIPGDVPVVEVGAERRHEDVIGTPFYLIAAVGIGTAERHRFDYDTKVVKTERDVLQSTLTQDPNDVALLVPAQGYAVKVSWRAAVKKQEPKPAATETPAWQPVETQTFRFAADGPDEAPKDLGPWMLASAPSMDETGVLCGEPIRIALATQNVPALFDAYGEELRVRVQAASGFHPEPPGGGPAGGPFTLPNPYAEADPLHVMGQLTPTLGQVMTPWQEAVTNVLGSPDFPCFDVSGSHTFGTIVTLPYDLQPLTDYLIDIEAVPKAAAADAVGRRVHRVGFTTSRFTTVNDLADLSRLVSPAARHVPNPAALTALPAAPSGDVLDAAYQAAGLTVPTVPRYPAVQVLWSGEDMPQPVAVVVESSESMSRLRPMPTSVSGPPDPSAGPGHKWWAAVDRQWLSLRASTTAPAARGPAAGGGDEDSPWPRRHPGARAARPRLPGQRAAAGPGRDRGRSGRGPREAR